MIHGNRIDSGLNVGEILTEQGSPVVVQALFDSWRIGPPLRSAMTALCRSGLVFCEASEKVEMPRIPGHAR
jgi:hypothetical protein